MPDEMRMEFGCGCPVGANPPLRCQEHGEPLRIYGAGKAPASALPTFKQWSGTVRARVPLTEREADIARLVHDGLPYDAIGRELGISEHTVHFHVAEAAKKLSRVNCYGGQSSAKPRSKLFAWWREQGAAGCQIGSAPSHSFIYFVRPVGGGNIKIGVSVDPYERLETLQNGSPVKLELIGYVAGSIADEAAMHQRFARMRLHGEWFSPEGELLSFLTDTFGTPHNLHAA